MISFLPQRFTFLNRQETITIDSLHPFIHSTLSFATPSNGCTRNKNFVVSPFKTQDLFIARTKSLTTS